MLALNAAGTHYTNQNLPDAAFTVPAGAPRERAGKPHEDDTTEYRVVHVVKDDPTNPQVKQPGRYLVDDAGHARYRTDVPINRQSEKMDNGQDAPKAFSAAHWSGPWW
jgi:hypothetical protein